MAESQARQEIPPASYTGRLGKLVVGAIQVWYAVECVRLFYVMTHPSLKPGIWLFVVFALWLVPFDVNLGYRRVLNLGYRPLWIVLGVAGLCAGWDWVSAGTPWGPTVGMWLLSVTIYVHLHVGGSHLLAAITGLKGCEMRVLPYYLTRLRGGAQQAELCLCPGFWTPMDRWEARLRGAEG